MVTREQQSQRRQWHRSGVHPVFAMLMKRAPQKRRASRPAAGSMAEDDEEGECYKHVYGGIEEAYPRGKEDEGEDRTTNRSGTEAGGRSAVEPEAIHKINPKARDRTPPPPLRAVLIACARHLMACTSKSCEFEEIHSQRSRAYFNADVCLFFGHHPSHSWHADLGASFARSWRRRRSRAGASGHGHGQLVSTGGLDV